MEPTGTWTARGLRLLLPALALATLWPAVTAPVALVAGLAFALVVGNPWQAKTKQWTTPLLQLAVVGLGFGTDLRSVWSAGVSGLGYTAAGIAACLLAGALLARVFRVVAPVGLLVTVGTAICGGSAIAAVAPVLRAKGDDVAVALAVVFVLNAAGLFLFPPIGHALGMSQTAFGMWAALAIHDTSSVVGAASQYGDTALAIATTLKLARALWIVPVALGLGAWRRQQDQGAGEARVPAKVPWFILGFVLAAAAATTIPGLDVAGKHVAAVARQLLVLTLFFVGVNVSRAALKQIGARPLLLGVVLWALTATTTAACIVAGVIRP